MYGRMIGCGNISLGAAIDGELPLHEGIGNGILKADKWVFKIVHGRIPLAWLNCRAKLLMSRHMKTKKPDPEIDEIELVPDAWPRFERFIKEIAKAGPQHRKPTEKPKTKVDAKANSPKKRGRPVKEIGRS
jgi:hypothetical protein